MPIATGHLRREEEATGVGVTVLIFGGKRRWTGAESNPLEVMLWDVKNRRISQGEAFFLYQGHLQVKGRLTGCQMLVWWDGRKTTHCCMTAGVVCKWVKLVTKLKSVESLARRFPFISESFTVHGPPVQAVFMPEVK